MLTGFKDTGKMASKVQRCTAVYALGAYAWVLTDARRCKMQSTKSYPE
jgi:hypothetical protein